jgi:hypothetical protein
MAELRQILQELGLADKVRIEQPDVPGARAVRIQPAGLRDLAAVFFLRLASPGWRPGSKPPTS